MNGVAIHRGYAYSIGLLDLAILQDAGVPMNHNVLASLASLNQVETAHLGILRASANFNVRNQESMSLDNGSFIFTH